MKVICAAHLLFLFGKIMSQAESSLTLLPSLHPEIYAVSIRPHLSFMFLFLKMLHRGASLVAQWSKVPPAGVGDMGSIPDRGGSHVLCDN